MVDRSLLLRRLATVRHCLTRVRDKAGLPLARFLVDYDAQDVVLRNLQVAIQAALDVATHLIADFGWQLPGTSAGSFQVLAQNGLLDADLAGRLGRAVNLRNLLVHAYDSLNLEIVYTVCQDDLVDLERFCERVSQL